MRSQPCCFSCRAAPRAPTACRSASRVDDERRFDALAQVAAQHARLALGMTMQRRAVGRPDLARTSARICSGRNGRITRLSISHHTGARDLDHARIGQELAQIAAHRGRGRRIGRAEIDQQHAVLAVAVGERGAGYAARAIETPAARRQAVRA